MIDWIKTLLSPGTSTEKAADPELTLMLQETLRETEAIYRSGARLCTTACPERIKGDPEEYTELMLDLHRGLLVKILIEIAECDRRWHPAEREIALAVLHHTWGVRVPNKKLARAIANVSAHAEMLKWPELLKPFVTMPPLANQISDLTGNAMRIANLVAKADGNVNPSEAAGLRRIQNQLESAFDSSGRNEKRGRRRTGEIDPKITGLLQAQRSVAVTSRGGVDQQQLKKPPSEAAQPPKPLSPQERQRQFDEAMEELDQLIGLASLKRDIRELIDFLKIQAKRKEHRLATAQVSLHTVFEGNPGTGKTTVARILGRLFCGMHILDQGHTIETDRSGLVAQYAGQTGPKTHERVDEALDGVLFVDEAYSLISEEGDDAFGVEAIQALLKRMEDDRDRLTVVLAGYPDPMARMLRSNPGLSSRFQRKFTFPDYDSKELLKIFRLMCKKNHYRLPKSTQQKLLDGFQHLIAGKDERFGNGRMVRNVFEQAIRRQASRIVNIAPLTREILSTLQPDDIQMESGSDSVGSAVGTV